VVLTILKKYGVRQWEGLYIPCMTWKIIHSCKFTHQPVFVGSCVIPPINHRIHPHFRFNQWMILWMIFPLHMGFSSDKR
jgi:hypothetical protein